MAKPIPVFSFVFAAYAATSGTAGATVDRLDKRRLEPCDPFLTAWRARLARGKPLWAKVGLLKDETCNAGKLALQTSAKGYDELWLGEIAESGLGFIGSPIEGQPLPVSVAAGQRLRFHQIHVLDWRVADCKRTCQQPQRYCVRRDPRSAFVKPTDILEA